MVTSAVRPPHVRQRRRPRSAVDVNTAATQVLCDCMEWHCPPPAALGTAQENLQHKVAGLMHSLSLETDGMGHLQTVLQNTVTLTTDMGVEMGIAGAVHGKSAGAYAWFVDGLEPAGATADDGEWQPAASDSGAFVFERAVPIPGLLHILDNITEDLHEKAMAQWGGYVKYLEEVCRLLCVRSCRDLFLATCVRVHGASGEADADNFFSGDPHSVTEWRWSSVYRVLAWLLPLRGRLQYYWDPRAYAKEQGPGEHAGATRGYAENRKAHRVDTEALTAAISSPFFWAYGDLLFLVQRVIESLVGWLESCPCHGHSISELCALLRMPPETALADRQARRSQAARWFEALAAERRGMFHECPMGGKRAAELACGALSQVFEALADMGKLLIDSRVCMAGLSAEESGQIAVDWDNARSHLEMALRAKTAFWQELPWRLCGLGHPSPDLARQCGRACMDIYDGAPGASTQHRAAARCLDPAGPLRSALEEFVRGRAMHQVPGLCTAVLEMTLAPTVERSMEQRHSMVNLWLGGKRRKHPTFVSLANRMLEFERRLVMQPAVLPAVAQELERVRTFAAAASLLNFTGHPSIVELWSRPEPAHHTAYEKPVTELFYHCHPTQQYRAHHDARHSQGQRAAQDRQRRQQLVANLGLHANTDGTYDGILQRAMLEHIQHVGVQRGVGAVFSFSAAAADSLALVALPDAMRGPRLSTSGPVANAAIGDASGLDIDDGGDNGDACMDSAASVPAGGALDAALPQVAPAVPVFARVVHSRPMQQLRLVPAAPASTPTLAWQDAAMTLHRAVAFNPESDTFVVCSTPEPVGGTAGNTIAVLRAFAGSPEVVRQTAGVWSVCESGKYFLDGGGARPTTLGEIRAVTALVNAGAYGPNGATNPLHVPINGALHADMMELLASGAALQDGPWWRLPGTATSRIKPCVFLAFAEPTFALKSVDRMAMDRYELLASLEADGWQWAPLPPPRRRQPFNLQAARPPKVWHSALGRDPPTMYLQCLANADALRSHGVLEIPHTPPKGGYSLLLKAAGLLPDTGAVGPEGALEVDGEALPVLDAGAPAALSLATARARVGGPGDGGTDGHSTGGSDAESAASCGQSSCMAGVGPEPAAPFDVDAALADLLAPSSLPPPPPPPLPQERGVADGASEAQGSQRSGRRPRIISPSELNHSWGVFRFTLRRVTAASGQEAYRWQASCPWHRLNERSGCRVEEAIVPRSGEHWEAASNRALRLLRHWCNQCFLADRQRDHVAWRPVEDEVPPDDVIEAQRVDTMPGGAVRTDVELDLQADGRSETPAAGATPGPPAPLPQQRRQRGQRQAARAAVRQPAPTAPSDPGPADATANPDTPSSVSASTSAASSSCASASSPQSGSSARSSSSDTLSSLRAPPEASEGNVAAELAPVCVEQPRGCQRARPHVRPFTHAPLSRACLSARTCTCLRARACAEHLHAHLLRICTPGRTCAHARPPERSRTRLHASVRRAWRKHGGPTQF